MGLRLAGIFPRSRPPRILWAVAPTGNVMAEYSEMFIRAADLALKRQYRRALDAGDPDPLAAAVQAAYTDPREQQEATLVLRDVLVIRREFGEDGVRQVRDRHALAGAWR